MRYSRRNIVALLLNTNGAIGSNVSKGYLKRLNSEDARYDLVNSARKELSVDDKISMN